MSRILKDALLLLVCLALIVPAALLASGKLPYQVYIVHTGSMTPTIPSRSAVLVEKGSYHLGQVISFRTQNGVVTHRLVKRSPDGTLITKGDANRTADPGSLRASQVVGGVLAAPRMLGYWLQYLKNPAGIGSLAMTIVCFWLTYSLAVSVAERRQLAQAPGAKWRTVQASRAKWRVGLAHWAALRGGAEGREELCSSADAQWPGGSAVRGRRSPCAPHHCSAAADSR